MPNQEIDGETSAEAVVSPLAGPAASTGCPTRKKKTKKAEAAAVSLPAGLQVSTKKEETGVNPPAGPEALTRYPTRKGKKKKKTTKKAEAAAVSPPGDPEAFAKKAETGAILLAGLEAEGSTFKQKKKTKKAKAAVVSPPAGLGASSAKKASVKPGEASKLEVTKRTRRLMRELKQAQQQLNRSDPAFTVELVGDNLSEWHVRLHQIDPESALANDLRELHIPHILLNLVFPENFPAAPPFMRVVEPVIQGGHVIEGGTICMELLTTGGWSSAYTVEALVLQFAATVVQGQGRVAWSDSPDTEYSRSRAEEAFPLMVQWHDKHGWGEPDLS
ncbi:hypothetical protein O0L34_g9319 [Tuta absoluta]|nr:hypothetical protein O0L34_g9319 [Tuta absoluta]